ncbi:MAG: DUF1330 domain-containing protein [Hyphomicrobiales bacterium]|nr:MAG: DUF1330 domain-containing protein [Hyphomicrobiales bacterium]
MAKGYWVVNLEVSDPEAYTQYQALVGPFLASSQGRVIIRGGRLSIEEGTVNPRVVVVEFPSYEHAVRAYNSPEYQAAMQTRLSSSTANFAIVEGFDG